MGNENENTAPARGNTALITQVITILVSLGLLGGGGSYMVNSGLDDLGTQFTSEIAVMKNDMEHIKKEQTKISEKFVDDFKTHVTDPNLHSHGQQRLRQEMKDERDKLHELIREPMKKQWELISELKDKVTKLEAWKDSLEDD